MFTASTSCFLNSAPVSPAGKTGRRQALIKSSQNKHGKRAGNLGMGQIDGKWEGGGVHL
jgi:hypothetical protein